MNDDFGLSGIILRSRRPRVAVHAQWLREPYNAGCCTEQASIKAIGEKRDIHKKIWQTTFAHNNHSDLTQVRYRSQYPKTLVFGQLFNAVYVRNAKGFSLHEQT
jgi:hypothetical protein